MKDSSTLSRKLYPSRIRNILLLVVSFCIVLLCIYKLHFAGSRPIFWLALVFFGFCVVYFILSLLPNSNYLEISAKGLTTCNMYITKFLPWSDVRSFRAGRIGASRVVIIDFNEDHISKKKGMFISERALPDNYGMTSQNLADLLNHYKQEISK